jgi:Trypsin-like peptidase domain
MRGRLATMIGAMALIHAVATGQGTAPPAWLDYWREATVAVGVVKKAKVVSQGKPSLRDIFGVVGTGVIVGAHGQLPLLLTAKHVLYDPKENWDPETIRIRFAWFDDRPVEDYLGVEIPLKKDGKRVWVGHPTADLAVISLAVTAQEAGRDTVKHVPVEYFASSDDIYEGAPVVVLGYPGAIGDGFWTRAVVRGGVVAWVSPHSPAGDHLLVDSLLFPANSGGPVFRVPSGTDRQGTGPVGSRGAFLGIVARGPQGGMPLSAGDRKIAIEGPAGRTAVVAAQRVGVGVIEPAARVRELIDSVLK